MKERHIKAIDVKKLILVNIHTGNGNYNGYITEQKISQENVIVELKVYGIQKCATGTDGKPGYKITRDTAKAQATFLASQEILKENESEILVTDIKTHAEKRLKDVFEKEPEKPTLKNISKERLAEIIRDYIQNDYESAETNYIKDVLQNICGLTEEEAEILGLSYILKN